MDKGRDSSATDPNIRSTAWSRCKFLIALGLFNALSAAQPVERFASYPHSLTSPSDPYPARLYLDVNSIPTFIACRIVRHRRLHLHLEPALTAHLMAPLVYIASTLLEVLPNQDRALRITDSDSHSPLTDDGFIATRFSYSNPNRRSLPTRREWTDDILPELKRRGTGPLWSKLEREEVDTVIEHVCGGWGRRASVKPTYVYVDSDDESEYDGFSLHPRIRPSLSPSPWISASQDLFWSVWEIARRLTVCHKTNVHLSVIRTDAPRSYRGVRVVTLNPLTCLREWEEVQYYAHSRLNDARAFAKASREILMYGRVFDKDVLETTVRSARAVGFKIPAKFKVPKRQRTGDWLQDLIWDPWRDSSSFARELVEQRARRTGRT